VAEIRRSRVSGRLDNHERKVGRDWVVTLQDTRFDIVIDADRDGSTVIFSDGTSHRVSSDWVPGVKLATIMVDGDSIILKVKSQVRGYQIRYRGADLKVVIETPRKAELAALMPEKVAADTSKFLLCPMPGLIVSVAVCEGDEVQEGQALCSVEAMKMENVLRAEKKAIVSKINVSAGDSLAVDEVIMEFET